MEEVREETKEIEVGIEAGEARAFYSDKGVEEGFVEERGFKKLVSPLKEEIKSRGWETVS